ncbi:LytR C-terminal domain-containing protein [Nocardioides sp.]|uniref:LytR C-terminal domain-containing protein n=1 Tax=Nocardioides sp. TaxID=35761 RepID=UPI00271CEEEE|nr:LytR C-terminal domain-containing protein [Nocardioides sp.]MDO9457860.1 LytR C-terminal domain-containing protein [Nocardioides sp.]
MNERVLGYVRTAVTLGVLALLLAFAVTRGLDAVSEPFPENEDPPVCVDSAVSKGDVLRVGGITVSVINAGTKNGLARQTLDDLEEQGFAGGELANQADPDILSAQIWSPGGRTAAVRLVATYLGGRVKVVDRQSSTAGITVVVGDRFPGVRKGRFQVKVTKDGTVCGPASLG